MYKFHEVRRCALFIVGLLASLNLFGQEAINPKHILRVVFLNPGVEYEYSLSGKSKISSNIGLGISMSYPNTTAVLLSHLFFISSFFELHLKHFYNYHTPTANDLNPHHNSVGFLGVKLIGRGKSIISRSIRTDNFDFAIGPTWGVQKTFSKFHLLFNFGPVYYADRKGHYGFEPIMIELNLGYNLFKGASNKTEHSH